MLKRKENEPLGLEFCPLTKQIFRHPILTSDGYRYELCALIERVNNNQLLSPITYEKIIYADYDLQLEMSITDTYCENRFQEYEKNELMNQLIDVLSKPVLHWRQALYQSNDTALIIVTLMTSAKVYFNSETSSFFMLSTLLTIGLVDFGFRMLTHNQNGFFGTIFLQPRINSANERFQNELGPF